jgi:hypothetical protein
VCFVRDLRGPTFVASLTVARPARRVKGVRPNVRLVVTADPALTPCLPRAGALAVLSREVGSGDGWFASEGGVAAVMVIEVQPAVKRGGPSGV